MKKMAKMRKEAIEMIILIAVCLVLVVMMIANRQYFIDDDVRSYISHSSAIESIKNGEVYEITIYKSYAEMKGSVGFYQNNIIRLPDRTERTIFLEFLQNGIENGDNNIRVKMDGLLSYQDAVKLVFIVCIILLLVIIGYASLHCYGLYTKGIFFKQDITQEEKKIIAYHEAGHALASKMLGVEVKEVSILKRAEKTQKKSTKTEYKNTLVILLSGREAEKCVFGENSIECVNDLEMATNIAINMVTIYGMAEKLVPISFKNLDYEDVELFGSNIHDKIGAQVEEILREAEQEARSIVKTNKVLLNKIAQTLFEEKKISGEKLNKMIKEYKDSL